MVPSVRVIVFTKLCCILLSQEAIYSSKRNRLIRMVKQVFPL